MPRRNGFKGPCSGKWILLASWLAVISGCTTAPEPSPYLVQIPILHEIPTDFQAEEGIYYRCYRRDDALAIVRELKAACLAGGQTPEECQAVVKPRESR